MISSTRPVHPRRSTQRSLMRDERGIVLDWLLKFAVWFALIGVVLFDAGAIVVNFVSLDSKAEELARILAHDIGDGNLRTLEETLARAESLASEAESKLVSLTVDQDGILRLELRRTADTLIVSRIGFIKKWGKSTVGAQFNVGRTNPFAPR